MIYDKARDLLKGRLYEVGLVEQTLFELSQTVVSQLHSLLSSQFRVAKVQLFQQRFQIIHRLLLTLSQQLLLLYFLSTSHVASLSTYNVFFILFMFVFHVHVRYMLSPVRLSVCLSSVCRLSVTLVRPTQAVEIFGNISTALGTLAMH